MSDSDPIAGTEDISGQGLPSVFDQALKASIVVCQIFTMSVQGCPKIYSTDPDSLSSADCCSTLLSTVLYEKSLAACVHDKTTHDSTTSYLCSHVAKRWYICSKQCHAKYEAAMQPY